MSDSITGIIDDAILAIPGMQSGSGAYAAALQAYVDAGGGEAGIAALRERVLDLAAARYRMTAPPGVDLRTFNDGASDILFDLGHERTVLAHGFSRSAPPNSRDDSYHGGYPARPGYDKGHAMSHAQGGLEGGPNYFPQAPELNRKFGRLNGGPATEFRQRGHVWRAIETYLASNPGLFCFVRLIYPPGNATDVPSHCEYGLLMPGAQFRAVVFPN